MSLIPTNLDDSRAMGLLKVHKRGGFSDRNGINKENTEIQLNEFDERTRITIYNTINALYFHNYPSNQRFELKQQFIREIFSDVYMQAIEYDGIITDATLFYQIKQTVFHDTYDAVLTIIEHIAQYWECEKKRHHWQGESYYVLFNNAFEKEYVGYRFIGDIIVPISNKYEVAEIEEAINKSRREVKEHIEKSCKYLADREQPDYENSIKESISAVEAMCEIITGAKGNDATLGKMLKKLEDNNVVIHSSMKAAFNQLYSYTNDANGIRHAGDIGGPSSTFEEAKFMLVSCSAFINYLKGLQAKIK